jgi:hypothetical protein
MPEPLTTASIGALSQGITVLEKVGLLEKIKNKLVSNPDAAAAKLAGVLNEIGKTYEVVDDAVVQFASMSFEDEVACASSLALLHMIRGGRLTRRMMDAKAHCSNVGAIYHRYLTGWFSDALNPQEQTDQQNLFLELQNADDHWVQMLSKVAKELEKVSKTMISYLKSGRIHDAERLREDVLKQLMDSQNRLSNGIVKLQSLKIAFFNISGATI